MTPARPQREPSPAPAPTGIDAQLSQLIDEVRAMRRELREALLPEQSRWDDAGDLGSLLAVIYRVTQGEEWWTSRLLCDWADDNTTELSAAIERCVGPGNPGRARRLGKMMRRIAGKKIRGLTVCKVGSRDRDGIRWAVQSCEF